MSWIKRIFLFMAVNFLVIITISILMSVLGIRPYLTRQGIDYESLLAFCLLWGMGGAFISLALSKVMAKWMMGVKILDPNAMDAESRFLVQTIHRLAQQAGLSKMPEVGIYDSPEVNAFATGPTKSRSLVAVSSGLLHRMDKAAMEGVLGHEISHIANGDMVTMTLIQGVVNAFVLFLSRVIAYAIAMAGRGRDDRDRGPSMSYYFIQYFVEIVLMILGSMVVAWFSRWREFRADRGGADLAGRQKMIGALQALQGAYSFVDPARNKPAFQALKISGHPRGFLRLFSTHPPLEERIARLQNAF